MTDQEPLPDVEGEGVVVGIQTPNSIDVPITPLNVSELNSSLFDGNGLNLLLALASKDEMSLAQWAFLIKSDGYEDIHGIGPVYSGMILDKASEIYPSLV